MKTLAMALGILGLLCAAASAQGITFGGNKGSGAAAEPRYPASPQYEYPYPYHDDARAKDGRKCRDGEVLYRGRCRPAQPRALPF